MKKHTTEHQPDARTESSVKNHEDTALTPEQAREIQELYYSPELDRAVLHVTRNPDVHPGDQSTDRPYGEYLYTDPQGIGKVLGQYRRVIHWYLQNGDYRTCLEGGSDFARVLVQTDAWDQIGEAGVLTLEEMCQLDLVDFSMDELLLDLLASKYLLTQSASRPSALFNLMLELNLHPHSLRGLRSCSGKELPGWAQFTARWVDYLRKPKRGADRQELAKALLSDAETLLPDAEA